MQDRGCRNASLGRGRLGAPLVGLIAFFLGALPATASEVRVLAAGAVQAAVQRLEPAIAARGHKLVARFDTVGALRERVLAGEAAEVVILSEAGMAALAGAGRIDVGSLIDLGATSVALAVRKGAEVPDVSSTDALKRVLLAASSIAHADPAPADLRYGVEGEARRHRLPYAVPGAGLRGEGRQQLSLAAGELPVPHLVERQVRRRVGDERTSPKRITRRMT
jgi:hypothetical protein